MFGVMSVLFAIIAVTLYEVGRRYYMPRRIAMKALLPDVNMTIDPVCFLVLFSAILLYY